jgi:hypothetical protein
MSNAIEHTGQRLSRQLGGGPEADLDAVDAAEEMNRRPAEGAAPEIDPGLARPGALPDEHARDGRRGACGAGRGMAFDDDERLGDREFEASAPPRQAGIGRDAPFVLHAAPSAKQEPKALSACGALGRRRRA